jgi:hypothetical protein
MMGCRLWRCRIDLQKFIIGGGCEEAALMEVPDF